MSSPDVAINAALHGGTQKNRRFSMRSFFAGLFLLGVICAAGVAGLTFLADKALTRQEEKLASQTVVIERVEDETLESVIGTVEEPVEPIVTEHVPVPDEHGHEHEHEQHHHDNPTPAQPDTTLPEPTAEDITAAKVALPRAPIAGAYEDTHDGRLPVIRHSDKKRPFDLYRRPFAGDVRGHQVALVFVDIGMSEKMSKTALETLPPDVTFAINPYATAPDLWVSESRRTGHEPWIILPVETALYPMDDPGPQTLLIRAAERQNLNKLYWTLSRAQGYAGVVTGHNPAFMRSAADVRPVLGDIYGRGLGFVDGDTDPATIPMSMASGYKAPYAAADLWIGKGDTTTESVSAGLRQLEKIAEEKGRAIAFIPVNPLTVELTTSWIGTLTNKNITLVPLSVIASL